MTTHEFDGLPEASRDRRQQEAGRAEADTARETGASFDRVASEIDAVIADEGVKIVTQETEQIIVELSRDVRFLFEARGDVKDSGSVDVSVVSQLGYDICSSPDLLAIIIDEARSLYVDSDGQVKVDDILKMAQIMDQREMERDQTTGASFVLADHGVDETEINAMVEEDPHKVRSRARLLSSPILAPFSERVMAEVSTEGRKFTMDELTVRALRITRRYYNHQAALQDGDPIAIELQRQIMDRPEMQTVLGELLMREEFELDKLPSDFPNPEDV